MKRPTRKKPRHAAQALPLPSENKPRPRRSPYSQANIEKPSLPALDTVSPGTRSSVFACRTEPCPILPQESPASPNLTHWMSLTICRSGKDDPRNETRPLPRTPQAPSARYDIHPLCPPISSVPLHPSPASHVAVLFWSRTLPGLRNVVVGTGFGIVSISLPRAICAGVTRVDLVCSVVLLRSCDRDCLGFISQVLCCTERRPLEHLHPSILRPRNGWARNLFLC